MPSEINVVDSDGSAERLGYGFFNRVTDARLFERIERRTASKKYFTDRVTSGRVEVRLSDIVLVVTPGGELAYVSHARPTKSGSTGTRGFKASGPLRVNIRREELLSNAGIAFGEEVRKGFEDPCFRPTLAAWETIWESIKRLRPNFAEEFRRIEQLRFDEAFEFDPASNDEQVYYEKDAVGVALDVAGISFNGVFAELSEGRRNNKSLVDALCGSTTEDVVISHDVRNFPDYVRTADRARACEFRQNNRKLTIFNVNRRPAERALGVDLIYHNLTYDAFTFIQYKMLEREGSRLAPNWRYRLDHQFDAEIARMRAARTAFGISSPSTPDAFRCGTDPFYFKLCRRQNLKVNSGQLVRGAYLNLTHCDLILGATGNEVPRILEPGRNVSRWMNRTHFTEFVAKGWTGTNNVSPAALKDYVEAALSASKSLLIAVADVRSDPDLEEDFAGED